MEPLLLGGVSGLVGAAAGFLAARLGRAPEAATGTALSPLAGPPRSVSDETELRRAREAADRWRLAALGSSTAAQSSPDFADRPSPRELERVAAAVSGLAFVDAVAVADDGGLQLSRGESPASRSLASLVPVAASLAAGLACRRERVASISLVTRDARVAVLRALPSWTGGAWLGALSNGLPPSRLALDAAVASAFATRPDAGWPAVPRNAAIQTLHGTTAVTGDQALARLTSELQRMVATDVRLAGLGGEGTLATAVSSEGPSPKAAAALFSLCERVRQRAARILHAEDLLRVEVTLGDGCVITFAPLAVEGRVALLTVTAGRPFEDLEVSRFVGRVRHLLGDLAPRGVLALEGA
ncbi:MAG: hypothetical protein JNK60_01895 [Acidobacteria bacterium]|nr:hypothetical protein [Acidobacteriota bacterium]